jgi:hypothetical protein
MDTLVNIEELPLFFILGRPRSGTTMLRSMFDAHPSVIIPPEFPMLATVENLPQDNWNNNTIAEFILRIQKIRKFENLKISAKQIEAALKQYLAENKTLNIQTAFKITNSLFESPFEKKEIFAIGDKNPLYSLYIKRLRKIFPDAKFVFIQRHLFSVLDSVYKTNFLLHWPSVVALQWKRAYKQAMDEINVNPTNSKIIKYEDLVLNTRFYLEDICKFIAIPYDENMMKFNEEKLLSKVYGDNLYIAHSSLLKDVSGTKLPKWEKVSKTRYKIALAWSGNSIKRAGYYPVNCRFKWMYWLFGLPHCFFNMGFNIATGILRFLTGKKFNGSFQMYLAVHLYGKTKS